MELINDLIQKGDMKVLNNLGDNIYQMNRNDTKYWDFMISNSKLDESLILENFEYINLELLIKNQSLTTKIILENNIWSKIISLGLINSLIINQKLDILIIEKLIEENYSSSGVYGSGYDLNLYNLCKYQNLSINFMNNNKDKIIWDIISENQFLTLEFIFNNKDLINWTQLGKNIKSQYLLNDSFLNLFYKYDISEALIWSKNISEEFINENLNKLKDSQIIDLLEIRKLSENTIINIVNKYYHIKDIFISISEGQDLSSKFIDDHFDLLDLDELTRHQNLSYDFIIKYKNIISLNKLSYNDNLNEELINKIYDNINDFKDEFDWNFISENIQFSKTTVKKIKELNITKIIEKNLKSLD